MCDARRFFEVDGDTVFYRYTRPVPSSAAEPTPAQAQQSETPLSAFSFAPPTFGSPVSGGAFSFSLATPTATATAASSSTDQPALAQQSQEAAGQPPSGFFNTTVDTGEVNSAPLVQADTAAADEQQKPKESLPPAVWGYAFHVVPTFSDDERKQKLTSPEAKAEVDRLHKTLVGGAEGLAIDAELVEYINRLHSECGISYKSMQPFRLRLTVRSPSPTLSLSLPLPSDLRRTLFNATITLSFAFLLGLRTPSGSCTPSWPTSAKRSCECAWQC
jgi:hypothetical protein